MGSRHRSGRVGLLLAVTGALGATAWEARAHGAAAEGAHAAHAEASRPHPADAFLAGYVTALLEHELGLTNVRVSATNGSVTVEGASLGARERERLDEIVERAPGARSFAWSDAEATLPAPGVSAAPRPAAEAAGTEDGFVLFPENELFEPLLADPRWPRFSGSYQFYLGDEELDRVGAVSFGESIPLLGGSFGNGPDGSGEAGRFELGLQAAVFSIFDLDVDSFDLVNSDFMAGVTGSYRRGRFSGITRVFHQSSHLGDEFLLRSRVDRINVSYEAVELLLSYELGSSLRLYGGGNYLFHRNPSDLEPASLRAGAELVSSRAFRGHLRPLVAVDVQGSEEGDWDPEIAARAGIQIETPRLSDNRLQILLEYYNGRSPNGQFFDRDIELIGLGAFLSF